jgi:glycosyltransferase involved in cell wall biosynthesis
MLLCHRLFCAEQTEGNREILSRLLGASKGDLFCDQGQESVRPLVSVICITYNHEQYIRDALEGIIMQETDFPIEILVSDDCSLDSTAKIINEYAKSYEGLFTAVFRQQNVGAQRNLIDLIGFAQAPYIALCEGDDYWTDKTKLQKQYDFMESHPECRICFHDARLVFDGIRPSDWFALHDFENCAQGDIYWPSSHKNFEQVTASLSLADYLAAPINLIPTASAFIRWNQDFILPEWCLMHQIGDFPLFAVLTGTDKIGYIPEALCCYRRHEYGSYYYTDRFTFWLERKGDWVKLCENLREYYDTYFEGYCYDELTKRRDRELAKFVRAVIKRCPWQQLPDVLLPYSSSIEEMWRLSPPPVDASIIFKLAYSLKLRRRLGILPFGRITLGRAKRLFKRLGKRFLRMDKA